MFKTFFLEGWHHIFTGGLDHILYLTALVIPYLGKNWKESKPILWLISAFTVGHFVSLSLASIKIFLLESDLVEQLIPITIILTAIQHFFKKNLKGKLYFSSAIFFGWIHGMAYSNDVFPMIRNSSDFLEALLGFNLGLELAQILISTLVFFGLYGLLLVAPSKHRNYWKTTYSVLLILFTLSLML